MAERWIYLDDDTILTQLTNEKSKNALGNFFKILKAEYKENVDYKKIKANDELIKIYESMVPAGIRNRKTIRHPTKNSTTPSLKKPMKT